ncbi:MAG: hypothetical protein IJT41_12085 [Clostridia bacterium]|nr:hypothetical protein [Clostridia bacterium]
MSVRVKRILGIFLSVVCIVTGTGLCGLVCNHPSEETENTVDSFYREPAGSLDAVLIGSSAAGKDYYPHVVWQTAGITSYCMNIAACSANIYSSVLREVLSTQPQTMILVDMDGFLVDDKYQTQEDPIRIWLDSMPRNRNWFETIRKLTPQSTAERLFPFMRYHRNMTSMQVMLPQTIRLLRRQVLGVRDPMKGATVNPTASNKIVRLPDASDLQPQPLSPQSDRVFRAFLEDCRHNGLDNVLFVDLPKADTNASTSERNCLYGARMQYMRRIVQDYGYSVYSYNVLDNPAQLDMKTDYADSLHLTTKGALKFSAYFAAYLAQQYSFPEKSAALASQWNTDVKDIHL